MEIIKIIIFFSILGAISSGIGGVITSLIKIKSKKAIATLFEFTAGIMTGIVCLDMLPESFSIAPIGYSIFGIVFGILIVFLINYLVEKFSNNNVKTFSNSSIVVMLSMGLHNAIEGLAIGSGFSYSFSLGLSLLISIFLHDIPEGMVVGIVSKKDTNNIIKIITNTVLVGAFVGIGCAIGLWLGKIDDRYIAFTLSIAAGAMLYIVSCDLIPSSKELVSSKIVSVMYIIGILVGAIFTQI